jgi:hypothetical protein
MRRVALTWALSLIVIGGTLMSPVPGLAGGGSCVLQGYFHDSWQCEFEAARIELTSCGACVWDAPDVNEWLEACPIDAPDGCVMIDPAEYCGEPEEYCEYVIPYVWEDDRWECEGRLILDECSI